jgi:BlaI family penicillinase repressor
MTKMPAISESEWKVMKALWEKSPQPAYDLVASFGKSEEWHPNTVKTLLSRLHKKKALGVKRYKNLYLYFPLVTEEACLREESDSFLNRLFGGSVKPLLLHFAQQQKISTADLDELKTILKKGKK